MTALEPKMWGPSIVGYGSYRFKYDSGREGEICRAGFSPRKAALTLYLVGDYGACQAEADALFAKLGKHSTGKACLYVKRLDPGGLGRARRTGRTELVGNERAVSRMVVCGPSVSTWLAVADEVGGCPRESQCPANLVS